MDDLPPPPPYAEKDPSAFEDPKAQDPAVNPPNRSNTSTSPSQPPTTLDGEDGYMSGAPYFAMRRPTRSRPLDIINYRMAFNPRSTREIVPFPSPANKFREREVNNYDWSTFLNYIFPLPTLPPPSPSQPNWSQYGGNEKRSRRSARPPPPVQTPVAEEPLDLEKETARRSQVQAVVEEWNDGFFLPRGLRVTLRFPLISPNLDLDARSNAGGTALNIAVAKGNEDLVRTLLLRGADPDIKPLGGAPSIYTAAEKRLLDVVKLLLMYGANPDATPSGKSSALWLLATETNSGFMNFFFPASDASAVDVQLIKMLLDYGANPNAAPAGRDPALCKAAGQGYKDLVQLLLKRGADVNSKAWGGSTALYAAVQRKDKHVTRLLIEHGADVDLAPSGKVPPLWHAVDQGDLELVKMLLQAGANINAKPWGGETVLYHAIEKGQQEILDLFLDIPGDGERKKEIQGEIAEVEKTKGQSS
ncbi:hypothetical protein MMC25_005271 [Agyrium rufum]|nr:hypothetical protein [Agyrium rufum]